MHGKNSTHDTNNCQTLKQLAEERKRSNGGNRNDKRNNKKKGYNPNKEEVHALVQFSKNTMNKDTNNELKNFENLLVSDKESK